LERSAVRHFGPALGCAAAGGPALPGGAPPWPAVELGLSALALTDHQGLYGAVRFTTAAEAAGLHPVVGIEIELLDPAVPDPGGLVVPRRRAWRPGRRPPVVADAPPVADGVPARPRPDRTLLPGHRAVVKEDHRGIGEPQRGPHLVLLARDAIGWRSLCRMVSRANLAGTKAVTGNLANSTGVLHIGGNAVWNEWFSGRIDEIRVYNRALSQAELQADMATPVH